MTSANTVVESSAAGTSGSVGGSASGLSSGRRFYPVPSRLVLFTALVTGVSMWWASRGVVYAYLNDWTDVLGLWRSQGAVSVAVGSGVAAYVGQWRFAIASGGPRVISAWRYVVWNLLPVVLATLVGMTVGCVPAALEVAGDGVDVWFDGWLVLSQVCGVVACLVMGYLVGVLFRAVLVPVGVGVGVLLVTYLAYVLSTLFEGVSFYGPTVFWMEFGVPLGWHDVTAASVLRVVLYVLVVFAAVDAVVRLLRGASRGRALLVFVLPVVMAVAIVVAQPELVSSANAYVCSEGKLVCVPTEAAADLPHYDAVARSIIDRYGYGALKYRSYDSQDGGGLVEAYIERSSRDETDLYFADATLSGIVPTSCETDWVSDSDTVWENIFVRIQDEYPIPWGPSFLDEERLLTQTDAQLKDWLTVNGQAIANCQPTTPLP